MTTDDIHERVLVYPISHLRMLKPPERPLIPQSAQCGLQLSAVLNSVKDVDTIHSHVQATIIQYVFQRDGGMWF